MSRIIERTINGETDKRMVLENGFISRQMDMGSTWQNVVVGIRSGWYLSKDEPIYQSPRFFIGLSAGTGSFTSSIDPITSSHFVGAYYGGGSATQLGFSSGSNLSSSFIYAWQPNGCLVLLKREKETDTSVTMHQIQTQVYGAASRNNQFLARIPIFFLFQKSASLMKGTICCPVNPPYGDQDCNLATFATCMSASFTDIPTILSGLGYAFYGTAYMPVTESTYGYLDSVSVYWDRGAYAAWEISDIAVVKKA